MVADAIASPNGTQNIFTISTGITKAYLQENLLCRSGSYIREGPRLAHIGYSDTGTYEVLSTNRVVSIQRDRGWVYYISGGTLTYGKLIQRGSWSTDTYFQIGVNRLSSFGGTTFQSLPDGQRSKAFDEAWLREPCRFMLESGPIAMLIKLGLRDPSTWRGVGYSGTNLDMLALEALGISTWKITKDQVKTERQPYIDFKDHIHSWTPRQTDSCLVNPLPDTMTAIVETMLPVLNHLGDPRW